LRIRDYNPHSLLLSPEEEAEALGAASLEAEAENETWKGKGKGKEKAHKPVCEFQWTHRIVTTSSTTLKKRDRPSRWFDVGIK
jgi:hypothetical protein